MSKGHSSNDTSSDKTNQQKYVSEKEYRHHIAAVGHIGNYFMFRECYLEVMSRDAALVLQKFTNRYAFLLKKRKLHKSEWFVFPVKNLEESLKMDRNCQTRVLAQLTSKKFIKVSKKGVPPKRIIWIDFLVINRVIEEAMKLKDGIEQEPEEMTGKTNKPLIVNMCHSTGNPVDRATRNPVDPYLNDTNVSEEEQNKHSRRRCRDGAKGLIDDTEEIDHAAIWANRLHSELYKRDRIRRVANMSKWRKEFANLMKDYTIEEIDQTLTWYIPHIGNRYVVHAYSAKTFCNEFDRIRDNKRQEEEASHEEMNKRDGKKKHRGPDSLNDDQIS